MLVKLAPTNSNFNANPGNTLMIKRFELHNEESTYNFIVDRIIR